MSNTDKTTKQDGKIQNILEIEDNGISVIRRDNLENRIIMFRSRGV